MQIPMSPKLQLNPKAEQTLLKWFWVIEQKMFVINDLSKPEKTVAAFNETFEHLISAKIKLTPSKYIRETCRDSRVVSRIDCLRPDDPSVHEDEDGEKTLNIFPRPPSPPPSGQIKTDEEGLELWLGHLLMICGGSDEDRKHFLQWVTHLIFRPERRIEHGVLIGGPQGTGKSTIGSVLRLMLGERAVGSPTPQNLKGNHNTYLLGKRLHIVEEIKEHGNHGLYNSLKVNFTSDHLNINPKNRTEYEVRNIGHLLFFSNHKYGLLIERDDRRLFIVWSDAVAEDADYFKNIYNFLSIGQGDSGVWQFWQYLKEEILPTLSDDFHLIRPPVTKAHRELAAVSASPMETWLTEQLASAEHRFFQPKCFFPMSELEALMKDELQGVPAMRSKELVAEAYQSVGLRHDQFIFNGDHRSYGWIDVDGWENQLLAMRKSKQTDKLEACFVPHHFQRPEFDASY
jgi:hypothetical protein